MASSTSCSSLSPYRVSGDVHLSTGLGTSDATPLYWQTIHLEASLHKNLVLS